MAQGRWVMVKLLGLLGVLLLTSACGSNAFRGPERGGPDWIEARSKNFRLLTNQGEKRALRMVHELEQTQAVLEQIAFPSTENPPGVTEVVVLPGRDYDELIARGVVPKDWVGYFTSAGIPAQPRFVMRDDMGDESTMILQHELTHRFVAFHCPNAPTWFNEGLATFWESLKIADGKVYFGERQRIAQWTPLLEMLETTRETFYSEDALRQSSNYTAASMLARVLYFEHRSVLNRYVNALKAGRLSAEQAWRESVGEDLYAIRQSFDHFFDEQGKQGSLPAPRVSPAILTSLLTDAEVHLLWASLWPYPTHVSEARREIEAALALEPESAEALLRRGFLSEASSGRGDIERALQLAPSRQSVLTGSLAYALLSGRELGVSNATLSQRLMRFRTLKAPQLGMLAYYFGTIGQVERGISLAAQAVRLDSSCRECYLTGSRLLELKGDLSAAVNARRAAVALAGEHLSKRESEKLRELEQRLAAESKVPATN